MILAAVLVSVVCCSAAVWLGLRVAQPGLALTADLRPLVRQTLRATAGAAVAALAVLAAAAATAPRTVSRPVDLGAGTTMLVVDLSGSIGAPQYAAIAAAMNSMARATPNRHVGLVFFSDSAAEALPPQTPAAVLRKIARFFGPDTFMAAPNKPLPPAQPKPKYPPVPSGAFGSDSWAPQLKLPSPPPQLVHANPWVAAFDGGTYIARGLEVARKALAGAGVKHGQVILFSDLADGAPYQLAEEILRDNRAGIRLRVVPLGAAEDDLTTWRRLTGPGSVIPNPTVLGDEQHDRFYGGVSPTTLIPFALLFAAFVGFLVWWRAPLRLKEVSA